LLKDKLILKTKIFYDKIVCVLHFGKIKVYFSASFTITVYLKKLNYFGVTYLINSITWTFDNKQIVYTLTRKIFSSCNN